MSINLADSAAPPSPFPAITAAQTELAAARKRVQKFLDKDAKFHCSAKPEAAIARVEDTSSSAAWRNQHRRLTPQLCIALFRSKSAGLIVASAAAQLRLPRAKHHVLWPLRWSGVCVYVVGVTGKERLRAMGGGGVGHLLLKMTTATAGEAFGKNVKRLMVMAQRHIAAVHAAASLEGAKLAIQQTSGRPNVPVDHKRVFELAFIGTRMGCAHNKSVLARCYVYGLGVAKDRAKGLQLGRESAAEGSSLGQLFTGTCYRKGLGVAKDYAEAARFYRLAAAQGEPKAEFYLGNMFFRGQGVEGNYAEAERYYNRAAAKGYAEAQLCLGYSYLNGQGVAQNNGMALRFFRLAAEQKHPRAQHEMGNMFCEGLGVMQDMTEAARLYRLAADQGDIISHINLHMMCNAGVGMMKDGAQADHHYRMAAAEIEPEDINQLMRTCNNPLAHIIRYGHPRPRDASCFFLQQ
jgi:TPR repeat protein